MLHYAIYILAIFSLSQSPVIVKLSQVPPLPLGFWRLLGAGIILLLFRSLKKSPKKLWSTLVKQRLWLLLTGFIFFVHLWTYAYSAQNTSIAHCMILFALNPLFTAIGAKLFFKEPLEKNVAYSYLFAIIGLFFLVRSRIHFGMETWWGEAGALTSALFYSMYALLSKRSRQNLDIWDFSIGIYFVCGLCFFAATLASGAPLSGYGSVGWWSILGMILIPTFLGHSLFNYLMNYMNINWMSCGKLLEPTLSTFVAFLVFREAISLETVLAFFFTSTAVVFLFFRVEFRDRKFRILLRKA